jgi:hypothetical protein
LVAARRPPSLGLWKNDSVRASDRKTVAITWELGVALQRFT